MRALLVGSLLCALVAVPMTASAHTIVRGFGDAPCLAGCMAHAVLHGHPCGMELRPDCPAAHVGSPPVSIPIA